MRRTLWIVLFALLVATGTVIGFEVGGRAGFAEGVCTASTQHELANSLGTIGILGLLRKGDIDGARDVLENTLDSSITSIRLTSEFSPRLQSFAPSLPNTDHPAPIFKKIAKYRESHPYVDPYAKPAVDWLLARYGTPPEAQH